MKIPLFGNFLNHDLFIVSTESKEIIYFIAAQLHAFDSFLQHHHRLFLPFRLCMTFHRTK